MSIKEQACGVIAVYREEEYKFLILLQIGSTYDNWSFPKGHVELGEDMKTTALRELEEETQIKDIEILDVPPIEEEYEFLRNNERYLKHNKYLVGFAKDRNVVIQETEIESYKWATYDEAMKTFTHDARKETLKKAKEYLDKYESGK